VRLARSGRLLSLPYLPRGCDESLPLWLSRGALRACRCSLNQIDAYRHKLSGPLLDRIELGQFPSGRDIRIDLHVTMAGLRLPTSWVSHRVSRAPRWRAASGPHISAQPSWLLLWPPPAQLEAGR
jgi:hypothetical protein